eukprot:s983_g15.t1
MTPSASPLRAEPTPQVNDLCSMGVIHQNVFYFEGRQRRRIYQERNNRSARRKVQEECAVSSYTSHELLYYELLLDLELHASVLTLILTLLLTPRGLLDPNYCDPYPSHKSATQFKEE